MPPLSSCPSYEDNHPCNSFPYTSLVGLLSSLCHHSIQQTVHVSDVTGGGQCEIACSMMSDSDCTAYTFHTVCYTIYTVRTQCMGQRACLQHPLFHLHGGSIYKVQAVCDCGSWYHQDRPIHIFRNFLAVYRCMTIMWECFCFCSKEAARDASKEPLLSSFLYASILSHDNFQDCLAFVLANRLSTPTLLATECYELFQSVFREDDGIVQAALADLAAVRERVGHLLILVMFLSDLHKWPLVGLVDFACVCKYDLECARFSLLQAQYETSGRVR